MQLDLLSWQRPADVIPFPASQRVGHFRRIAERLRHARTKREADHIWERAYETAWRQMEKAGIDVLRIEYECDVLLACAELMASQMAGHPSQPDGGAA